MARPTKTPVWVLAKAVGAVPECSTARHAVSSSSRCCGSIRSASRVDMPEERRVEPVHVIDEARAAGDDLAGRIGIRVVELVDVPAVRRHLRDRVSALAQHLPELVGIGGTRNAQCIADYRKTLPDPLCFTSPRGCLDCQGVVLSAVRVFDQH